MARAFGAPLSIEELHLSPPRSGEVQVRTAAVAVCGSDIHAIDGAWGGALPAVYGHEAAGVVVDVGSDVTAVAAGDAVVVALLRTCRTCFYCRGEQSHLCETTFALDTETRLHDANGAPVTQGIGVGAFAEEVVVHESQVSFIGDGIPLDAACLLACGVTTGYGAVANSARVPAGASVAVVGVGGVGVNCLQGARAAGAGPVIAVDVDDDKLAGAGRFGASHVVRAGEGDVVEDIAALTGGRGADYVFVAIGSTRAIEQALDLVRPGGTLIIVGMAATGDVAGFEMSSFAAMGKRILGSRMGSTDLARDLPVLTNAYAAGELLLDELISARYPLEEINEAIATARRPDTLRTVVTFEGVSP